VSDHDARDFRVLRENRVDPVCKRRPMRRRDVLASDVGHLLYVDVGVLLDLGDGVDEFLPQQRSALIFRQAHGRAAFAGDRAACR